jgi:hypothetical protein
MDSLAYSVVSARALYDDPGYLIIRALINVTATNCDAYIERSPILIFPPSRQYYAMERKTTAIGGDVILPRAVTRVFPMAGGKSDTITITARTNSLNVKVATLDPEAPSSQALVSAFKLAEASGRTQLQGGGEVPSAHKATTTINDVATGYSSSLSFEEAFRDALRQLPSPPPDALWSVRVTGTGGEFGWDRRYSSSLGQHQPRWMKDA